jgi:dTDP-4-dehydrorhamnose 3,5-epimerase
LNLIKTYIPDLVIIQPDVYPDDRGYFFESYQKEKFREMGIDVSFVQDNESMSVKNVLRGLHFQVPPFAQAKLVRVARGSAQDIAVDLRKGSPTYGKWYSVVLSDKERNMMFIPEGFAHGFLTLEDNTIFQYKCSNYYSKESEGSIIWDDPTLGIDWMSHDPLISGKDLKGSLYSDFKTPFIFSGKPS